MIKFKRRATLGSRPDGANQPKVLGTATTRKSGKVIHIDEDTQHEGQFVSTSSTPSSVSTPLPNTSMSILPITVDLGLLLDGIGNDLFSAQNDRTLYAIYRDMYYHDPVSGSTVDMQSSLPFSDFSLGGINNAKINKVYMHIMERLNVRTLLPEISTDHMVLGAFIGSLLYDKTSKVFTDIMPHPIENVNIIPLPFYSQAPILEVTFPKTITTLLSNTKSPRVKAIREKFGEEILSKIMQGTLELDPLSTVYLPRRTFSFGEGTSYYKRALPIWLLEKNLYRGTLLESARRQRGIAHLTVGDGDTWEPSSEDLDFVSELFTNASADPLGAFVATRLGVSLEEVLCLCGDMRISTREGLIPIETIIPHNPDDFNKQKKAFPVDLQVRGFHGDLVDVDTWMYQGYKPVVKITTSSGTDLKSTETHKLLTLNDDGDLVKVPVESFKELNNKSYIVSRYDRFDRSPENPYRLNLTEFPYDDIVCPEFMTPKLAYILGVTMSYGQIDESVVTLVTFEEAVLAAYSSYMCDVFGLVPTTSKSHVHKIHYDSKPLVKMLQELGLVCRADMTYCNAYTFPESIFRSDHDSRVAFIAGLMENRGSVIMDKVHGYVTVILAWWSYDILENAKILLADMGIMSTLDVDNKVTTPSLVIDHCDSSRFYNMLVKYLRHSARKPFIQAPVRQDDGCSVPTDFIKKLLTNRRVTKEVYLAHEEHGCCAAPATRDCMYYVDDAGEYVYVCGCEDDFDFNVFKHGRLLRSIYKNNGYEPLLSCLRQVSEAAYNKLIALFDLDLRFESVTKYESIGHAHVYDISIKQPSVETLFVDDMAFREKGHEATVPTLYTVGGGLLTSNSPDGTWKYTDIVDTCASLKYKAYGINESLISGEATLNTMDNTLTMFIDHLRTHRDMITRKFFYNTMFPLIAVIHGYTVGKDSAKVREGDSLLQSNIEDTLSIMQDGSSLFIPSVHWAKQLKPEGDTNYFDILDRLTADGVPIPIRVVAAAGGFNIHDLLSQREDDIENRISIARYNKAIAEVVAKYGAKPSGGDNAEADDAYGGFASASGESALLTSLASSSLLGDSRSSVLAPSGGKRPNLTKRFNVDKSEVVGRTRTGKPKYIHNQKAVQDTANMNIIKAMRHHRKHGRSQLTDNTETDLT